MRCPESVHTQERCRIYGNRHYCRHNAGHKNPRHLCRCAIWWAALEVR